MSQKDQRKSKKNAGSTAKDRTRQRTHADTKDLATNTTTSCSGIVFSFFFFFCILITRSQKFLPNGKARNQFFLQQGQFHKC